MEHPEDHITRRTARCRIPGMDEVILRRDFEYEVTDEGALTFDAYYPGDLRDGETRPVVVSVSGYPDPGMERMLGCKFKEWGWSSSWGRLIAASGLVAVTYTNREPGRDIHALLRHLRENAPALGIDGGRIGLLASSGHGPLALSVLMDLRDDPSLLCAALLYPFTLDLDGFTAVADAAATFRFANPSPGRSLDDLPRASLFLARAGQDQTPGLNASLDRFVAVALAHHLPVTLVNHPDAPHAFDLMLDDEPSAAIVRSTLGFLRVHLGPAEAHLYPR